MNLWQRRPRYQRSLQLIYDSERVAQPGLPGGLGGSQAKPLSVSATPAHLLDFSPLVPSMPPSRKPPRPTDARPEFLSTALFSRSSRNGGFDPHCSGMGRHTSECVWPSCLEGKLNSALAEEELWSGSSSVMSFRVAFVPLSLSAPSHPFTFHVSHLDRLPVFSLSATFYTPFLPSFTPFPLTRPSSTTVPLSSHHPPSHPVS
ncbi:hypothetical protein B0H11DRAFT_209496 [Mycena galericulata]|nr:hypothetical protein B0H11DRAFT_209496 [Mycena galericulata]